jgi:hypothetical protein
MLLFIYNTGLTNQCYSRMKKYFFIFTLSVLIISTYAQESFTISKPNLQFLNNVLTVRYDISGCQIGETLNIRLIILNSDGDTIKPVSVSGDIGKNITCGTGKSIRWDVTRDNISINDNIDIMVSGEKITAKPVPSVSSEDLRPGKTNLILSSLIVPGLGQKKASGKTAYLVFSGIVYGAGAASAYCNVRSATLKDQYLAATGTERDQFYAKWEKNYNMSKYLAIGAAGAWVVNIIWTVTMHSPYANTEGIKLSFVNKGNREFLVSARLTF